MKKCNILFSVLTMSPPNFRRITVVHDSVVGPEHVCSGIWVTS